MFHPIASTEVAGTAFRRPLVEEVPVAAVAETDVAGSRCAGHSAPGCGNSLLMSPIWVGAVIEPVGAVFVRVGESAGT